MTEQALVTTRQSLTIDMAGTAMTVTAVTDVPVTIETASVGSEPEISVLRLSLIPEHVGVCTLHELTFSWILPVIDMRGLYLGGNPGAELAYLPFWSAEKSVCANSGVPFLALIDRTSNNRFAFGLADQLTGARLQAQLSEGTRSYHFTVRKPAGSASETNGLPVTGRWEETVFVSRQRTPWPEVLRGYTAVVDATGESRLPVPETAYAPVYCSWYAIHHDVHDDWARRQAAIAANLGFGTWITDDGWFLDRGAFADYSEVGEWEPAPQKFPDFREHVAAIQALGLRYLLWVAPFMIGEASEAAARYRDLLIPGQELERFENLSPWRRETKDIVTDLLVRLVTDYGLDGLKIDFLDAVKDHDSRPLDAAEASFGERFSHVMTDAVDALTRVKADLLIEFRNSYSNLASRRYANLYRSSDVPFNSTLNRWQAVFLRFLAPDRAVQLDPVVWHPEEPNETVAVHLINSIVSVPTISIDLELYPQDHLRLIRHWLGFYNDHREALVHGEFRPVMYPGFVPAVEFASESETIVALYDDVPVSLARAPRLWLLNASARPYIELAGSQLAGACQIVERDAFGEVVATGEVRLPLSRIAVAVGGCLEIVPNQ